MPLPESGLERGRMLLNDMTVGAHLGHHEDYSNALRPPTPFGRGKTWHQPTLSVERDQSVLEIPEPGLGFDNEQCTRRVMPGL